MKRLQAPAIVMLSLLLVGAPCGGRRDSGSAATSRGSLASGQKAAQQAAAKQAASEKAGSATGGTQGATGGAGTTGTASPGVGGETYSGAGRDGKRFPLVVEMAECIERGRPATATIRTVPGSMIGASSTYSDQAAHGNYWVGAAGADGRYPVAWTPPPDAPLGPGRFLAGAQSATEGGATVSKPFTLRRPGECS